MLMNKWIDKQHFRGMEKEIIQISIPICNLQFDCSTLSSLHSSVFEKINLTVPFKSAPVYAVCIE